MKLNLGCGYNVLEGYLNVDKFIPPTVFNESCYQADITEPLSFLQNNSVDQILLSHVIEHIPTEKTLPMMEELYRVAKPGCEMLIITPYGSSDDAWEDPTHIRPYFVGSFGYFSQPYYWRADYGYKGDWFCSDIFLNLNNRSLLGLDISEAQNIINTQRNQVIEMKAILTAMKPARPAIKDLQVHPLVHLI